MAQPEAQGGERESMRRRAEHAQRRRRRSSTTSATTSATTTRSATTEAATARDEIVGPRASSPSGKSPCRSRCRTMLRGLRAATSLRGLAPLRPMGARLFRASSPSLDALTTTPPAGGVATIDPSKFVDGESLVAHQARVRRDSPMGRTYNYAMLGAPRNYPGRSGSPRPAARSHCRREDPQGSPPPPRGPGAPRDRIRGDPFAPPACPASARVALSAAAAAREETHPSPIPAAILSGGAKFIGASAGRLAIVKFLASLNPAADVLALANLEVDISSMQPGDCMTVKWRGKPVFVRARTGAPPRPRDPPRSRRRSPPSPRRTAAHRSPRPCARRRRDRGGR